MGWREWVVVLTISIVAVVLITVCIWLAIGRPAL